VATEPTPEDRGRDRPSHPDPRSRGRIGWVVAGSLATGLVAALLLVAAPFIPAEEPAVTGAVLCGFALGWAMLAVLSVRFTDQPQRWAAAPALLMGVGGLLLVGFGSPVDQVLNWVWPPAMLALAIWMIVGVHRQLHSRGGRWLLDPVIAVLALASIGGGYQTLGEAADAKAYPMPGRLVDVGGHRLHLSCTGAGTPTVVLEPGAGEMSSILGWIAPAVARDTRVCVYDRAGRGWSEPADSAQDGAQIATDLHTLLRRGHVPGPYVLAGHSFGGLYVLTFAARYPDEVAGMVLVDSTAPASAANPGTPSPGHGAPPTAWAVSRRWCRPQLDWVWPACTPSPPSAACRHGPGTRSAPASPPQARCAARSTSTSRRRPRPSRLPPSVTWPTSR
jgi:pimeloyl-ACP methyl ester carboxylesterase